MLPVQCMQIIKYTFDVPVVAMVSHIPAKSRMAVNYVMSIGSSHISRYLDLSSSGSTLANINSPEVVEGSLAEL